MQPDMQCTQNEIINLKSDDIVHRLCMHTENKAEENEFKRRTNNELNQNQQVTQDKYNLKFNKKKSLKNKICNFSKKYSKPLENGVQNELLI